MNVKADQINAKDAAVMIGCDVSKVYSLARSGELDSINVGLGNKRPRYMFNKSEIDRYMRQHNRDIRQHSSLYTQSVVNSQKTPEEYEQVIREKEQEIHDLREALCSIKRNLELQVVDIASKVM